MGCNRENVVWKSPDGTWNRGFYEFFEVGDPSDDDFDYEWDVEYQYDDFFAYRGGFASEEAAANWQPGANPGGHVTVNSADKKAIADLERIALRFADPEAAEKLDLSDSKKIIRDRIKEVLPELHNGTRVYFVISQPHRGRVSIGSGIGYAGRVQTDDSGRKIIVSDRGERFVIGTPTGRASAADWVSDIRVQAMRRYGGW